MSIEYLNAAFKAQIKPSSLKFVLVALADFANEVGEAYPSIQTMESKTSQNRKTVMANYAKLVELGVIYDTGERKGKTKSVVVYQIVASKLNELKSSPKKGTTKQSQKRDTSKNEAVPFLPDSSPKKGTTKQSQKRYTEPSVLLTISEPPDLGPPEKKEKQPKSAPVWESYLNAYRYRYGVDPIRNAKVNSILCKLVDSVGQEEAIAMAAYYVAHNKQFYVQSAHKPELLLSDAQAIRTDMLNNTQTTNQSARDIEKTQSNFSAAAEAKRMLMQRGGQA